MREVIWTREAFGVPFRLHLDSTGQLLVAFQPKDIGRLMSDPERDRRLSDWFAENLAALEAGMRREAQEAGQ